MTPPEKQAANLRESVAVQEQIIDYCDRCEIRGAILFTICFSSPKNGKLRRRSHRPRSYPTSTRGENALLYFTEGEEKRKVALSALKPPGWSMVHHLSVRPTGGE